MSKSVRIGTRGSPLALRQAEWVARRIVQVFPKVCPRIVSMESAGDVDRDTPLTHSGMLGSFTSDLDHALADGHVDAVVHSLKDLPILLVPGTRIVAVPDREDPRDAFITDPRYTLNTISSGSIVGAGCARRQAFLLASRPDITATPIRGNVDTRIGKVFGTHEYDAVVLAVAGLRRLRLFQFLKEPLDPVLWPPAPGQGALAIVAREDDADLIALLQQITDPPVQAAVIAERAVLEGLGGGCDVPMGAYGRVRMGRLVLDARLSNPEGTSTASAHIEGSPAEARSLGLRLARRLLEYGDNLSSETFSQASVVLVERP